MIKEKSITGLENNMKQHNNFKTHNKYIRMTYEGSCDTEDWSNDAENSALHHWNQLYLKVY